MSHTAPAHRVNVSTPPYSVLEAGGLTSEQVAERTSAGLVNTQNNATSRSTATIIRTHLFTMFNLVLGLCGLAVILVGSWLDTLFLLAAIANVVIGFTQEFSAKRQLDRIALLRRDPATALRDGKLVPVALDELVLDDVVLLKRGDQVPADAVVLTSDGLDLDESLLTGENDPVGKVPGDGVLSASSVIGGSGKVRLTAVGATSRAAKITAEARQFTTIHSELRAGMERVVTWITWALVPIIAIVLNGQMQAAGGWQLALDSGAWRDALITSVSSVASMIPQGLALMTTISFAVASVKLARTEVLIQEQPAVEVLARVDTVCFDKTGTLTEGGVRFDSVRSLTGQVLWAETGHQDATAASRVKDGWAAALGWLGADRNANPTAAALKEPFAEAADAAAPAGASTPAATGVLPFSSALRFSGVEFTGTGAWLLGAPEALLPEGSATRDLAGELAESGLRVLVLAHAPALLREPSGKVATRVPAGLEPQVLVIFREQVRSEAPETLAYFRSQGIDLKVFSGDTPRTVAAAAAAAGMDVSAGAVDASTLPESGPELVEAARTHAVFGRVSPEQKKNMVLGLREAGHVVAMTGDGINDALALKYADLGIAMGNAAPATKAVSRLVLLDGRFDRLPGVLAEGRKIIANIERVTNLFLTKTAFAILLGLTLGVLCWQFPFLPRQYSTADLLIVGGPAFFLTMLPNTRRYVSGFLGRALHYALPAAVIITAVLVFVNGYGRSLAGVATAEIQTATFIALVLMGIYNITTVVRPVRGVRLAIVAAMYAGLALVLLLPPSLWYHQFTIPTGAYLLATLGSAALGCLAIEVNLRLQTAWLRAKHPQVLAQG
ncbi:HAD family hydrolase [Rothia nasimurium]|uniref:HAD family hydrolase n=1 Tax=Rothia nasimurium TaxID=85336 RepID=A0A4Y9F226_9MICC|nr:HAD-IC family P-type ATPase [Rothia nasimurium]MBF0809005.1 HAD-IC family P-type ATPase [Rothia nasimurium]TFU20902.1 HAD family hydrolase [Rothia nasimurium]